MRQLIGILALSLCLLACGDDDGPTFDSAVDDTDGAATDGAATPDGAAAACTGCMPAEGCMHVDVVRNADTSSQPWVVWPMQADGVGTLIVSAYIFNMGTTVFSRETVANADMTPENARYSVDLGCVPAQALKLRAILDDNLNAMPDEIYSSDYLDSCMAPRELDFTVVAGMVNEAELALNNSCD